MGDPRFVYPRRGWDVGAEAWADFVRSGADYYRLLVHGPALLSACAPCAGLDALDLGCGEGYFSRGLAGAGANVVAVDVSPAQLAFARGEETRAPMGITYEVLDARELASRWPSNSFDLVVASMSLQDMPDAQQVIRQVVAMLRRPGRFLEV